MSNRYAADFDRTNAVQTKAGERNANMELNEIRVEIDKLDRELQQLFEQRMQL